MQLCLSIHVFQKLEHSSFPFFLSFFHLLYLQNAIRTLVLSSKDLSPILISKYLPSYLWSIFSSRLSGPSWNCDCLGKGAHRKTKTTVPPYSSSKRTDGKSWALPGFLYSMTPSSCQPAKPLNYISSSQSHPQYFQNWINLAPNDFVCDDDVDFIILPLPELSDCVQ